MKKLLAAAFALPLASARGLDYPRADIRQSK